MNAETTDMHWAELLDQANDRIEQLREMLRPFAKFADRIPDSAPDALTICPSWTRDHLPIATALDFRRAAALLAEIEQE
jgi:hypothetical protein